MNLDTFLVIFVTGEEENVILLCGSHKQARIIAQARQIQKGNKYKVKSVWRIG